MVAPTEPQAARRIAVLIPCYNEDLTIGAVVQQLRAELPRARIYVFDNNSTDRSAEVAKRAGAEVFRELRQGKGYVVQSMFREVDADLYVMVDGDGTYAASSVHRLLGPLLRGDADMVVGSRLHAASQSDFRPLNRLGNRLFLLVINSIFRVRLTDLLSGFRGFTHQFVKGLPLSGGGFEVETELTIKGLQRGYRIEEVPVDLVARPAGSHSKVRRFRDGIVILNTIFALFRDYKPLTFFGSAGLLLIAIGVVTGAGALWGEPGNGARPAMARTVVGVGCLVSGLLSAFAGLILHTVLRRFQEFEHHFRTVSRELRLGRFEPREFGAQAEEPHAVD
jgi:glycosyltransferase involved in cell wall biosynthesis